MARPLPKRWIAIVAGVVAVALIVVAALLSARDDVTPTAEAVDTSATVDATGTAGVPSAPVTGTSQPAAPGTTGGTPGATTPGATGSTGRQPAPTGPAPAGSALTTVTTPPQQTLAMIDGSKATPESTYDVTFGVYGYGPGGGTGSLVISVTRSAPVKPVDKPYEFAGRNVLVRLGPTSAGIVGVGGVYRGTITLKTDGSVLVPVLTDVRKDS